MRTFYEEWKDLEINSPVATGELQLDDIEANTICGLKLTNYADFPIMAFLSIGFTHHTTILTKVKSIDERKFYIQFCYNQKLSVHDLQSAISENVYRNYGRMPNNFTVTIPEYKQAFKAIQMFKDEYLLDYLNVEQLGMRDEDIDEKVIENQIIHNIRNFIMTFGKGFAYIGNQVHFDKLGHDHWVDLLFFNRVLRSLVVVELKKGKFKPIYLGQLSHYLHILDDDEKMEGENPSVGIILCKDADKTFVEYVLHDYNRPMGVATYKFNQERLKDLLPDEEELKNLIK